MLWDDYATIYISSFDKLDFYVFLPLKVDYVRSLSVDCGRDNV